MGSSGNLRKNGVELPVCVYVCMGVYVFICMCVYVYVYVCACVCIRVYMCVCVCVHACVFVRGVNTTCRVDLTYGRQWETLRSGSWTET